MLSRRHNAVYRPLVQKAWLAHCARSGKDPENKSEKDQWYRKQLVENFGFYTTKQARSASDVDRLCLHFATIAGDEKAISYFVQAEERRALWVLRKSMARSRVSDSYVQAMSERMGFSLPFTELPAESILKLNMALSMHNRRKAKVECR